MDKLSAILKGIGVGVRAIDDPLFNETYEVCKLTKRMGFTIDEQELYHNAMDKFGCNVVGCNEQFSTILDYEMHYNRLHRYVCQDCKKILPTPKILDIHILESHDSYFQVKAQKEPMYQCYLSECNLTFKNSEYRRLHCINIHKFPKKFRYDELDKNKNNVEDVSMEICDSEKECNVKKGKKYIFVNKKKHQKGFVKANEINTENINNTAGIFCNESNFVPVNKSSLMFLPRQVQQKSFAKILTKSEKNTVQNVLESDSIMDIADVLPEINK